MNHKHLSFAVIVVGGLLLPTALQAEGPSCKTISVAASKVWLEKNPVHHTLLGSVIDWLTDLFHLQNGQEDNTCDYDARSSDFYYLDADLDFQNTGTFTVPDMIPVIEGKSRPTDSVMLEMGVHDCDGFTGVVTCTYKRRAPNWTMPLVLDQWQRYDFKSCSVASITPGKVVTGNALSLHVAAGGKNCPDRRTTVAFNLNACGVGELLPPTNTASSP